MAEETKPRIRRRGRGGGGGGRARAQKSGGMLACLHGVSIVVDDNKNDGGEVEKPNNNNNNNNGGDHNDGLDATEHISPVKEEEVFAKPKVVKMHNEIMSAGNKNDTSPTQCDQKKPLLATPPPVTGKENNAINNYKSPSEQSSCSLSSVETIPPLTSVKMKPYDISKGLASPLSPVTICSSPMSNDEKEGVYNEHNSVGDNNTSSHSQEMEERSAKLSTPSLESQEGDSDDGMNDSVGSSSELDDDVRSENSTQFDAEDDDNSFNKDIDDAEILYQDNEDSEDDEDYSIESVEDSSDDDESEGGSAIVNDDKKQKKQPRNILIEELLSNKPKPANNITDVTKATNDASSSQASGANKNTAAEQPQDFSHLTVVQLKEKLRELNLHVSGRKQELIDRLMNHFYPNLNDNDSVSKGSSCADGDDESGASIESIGKDDDDEMNISAEEEEDDEDELETSSPSNLKECKVKLNDILSVEGDTANFEPDDDMYDNGEEEQCNENGDCSMEKGSVDNSQCTQNNEDKEPKPQESSLEETHTKSAASAYAAVKIKSPAIPAEPSTSKLYDVVDNLFREADKDTVTVKDIVRSVASHFNLPKVEKGMKKMIKARLTDLIQGNVELDADGEGSVCEPSFDENEMSNKSGTNKVEVEGLSDECHTANESSPQQEPVEELPQSTSDVSFGEQLATESQGFGEEDAMKDEREDKSMENDHIPVEKTKYVLCPQLETDEHETPTSLAVAETATQPQEDKTETSVHLLSSPKSDTSSAEAKMDGDFDDLAMSDSLFQNLSPDFSVKSKTPKSFGRHTNLVDSLSLSNSFGDSMKTRNVVEKGKWSLGSEIGAGSFGRVYTGMNAVNGSE